MNQKAVVGALAVALVVFASTADDGATEHAAALLLRGFAAVGVVLLWPRTAVAQARLPRWAAWPMAAALGAVALGVLLAPQRALALQPAATALLVVLLCAALTATSDDEWIPAIGTGLLAAAALHALWAVGQRLLGSAPRGTGGFFNPNELAACLAPLALITVHAALDGARQGRRRWLMFGLTAILLGGLAASSSRGGAIAFGVGLVVWAAIRRQKAVLLGAVVLAAALLLTPGVRARFAATGDAYAYSRLEIWRASAELGARALPLGVGLNFYAEAMRRHGVPLDGGLVRFPRSAGDAHNEVLNTWVELGVPGVVALLWGPLALAWVLWRTRRNDPLAPRDLGVLTALAIPACLGDTLHLPPLALGAAVWAAGVLRRQPGAAPLALPTGPRPRAALALACLPVMLILSARATAESLSNLSSELSRQEPARALKYARWARALAPGSLGLALDYERLRHLTGTPALEIADALVELAEEYPHSPKPLRAAATLLAREAAGGRADQWEVVARFLAEAAERDPQNALAWHQLAAAYENAGDQAAAGRALARAVLVEPYFTRALTELAAKERASGNDAEAERLLARAAEAERAAPKARGRAADILRPPEPTPEPTPEARPAEAPPAEARQGPAP